MQEVSLYSVLLDAAPPQAREVNMLLKTFGLFGKVQSN